MVANPVETKKFRDIVDRVSSKWKNGTVEILEQRNPSLLKELHSAYDIIDSLMAIPEKPSTLKRQLTDAFDRYEKVAMACIAYACRHLPETQKSKGDKTGG